MNKQMADCNSISYCRLWWGELLFVSVYSLYSLHSPHNSSPSSPSCSNQTTTTTVSAPPPPPHPPPPVHVLPMSPPHDHVDYIGLAPTGTRAHDDDLKGTELRLGLPGSESPDRRPTAAATPTLNLLPSKGAKRVFAHEAQAPPGAASGDGNQAEAVAGGEEDKKVAAPPQPAAKAQVVGWPPVRNYRKNTMATSQLKSSKEESDAKQGHGFLYVKVSMDGAPYLRKVDLKTYKNYKELSLGLEKMFVGFSTSRSGANGLKGKDGASESRNDGEFVLTYEDKDGDWMLVGDVPWKMFTDSCRRLRIMKGSDAIGLAPRAGEKSKNKN